MRTYGVSNKGVIEGYYVAPSARVKFPHKCGKARNVLRNTRNKRILRIQMKRTRRQRLKHEMYNELNQQKIKTMWVNFYNAKTGESFSYEESETVYVLKAHKDYDLSDDESRTEFQIDKIDSEKEIGYGLNKSYLIPVMAEYVKIGQTIYDVDLNYEGYRKE